MIESDQFVDILLGRSTVNVSVSEAEEDEGGDDETIKDILGPDYLEKPKPKAAPGGVNRYFHAKTHPGRSVSHKRWANVEIGNNYYCVSYLTPVAVYIAGEGVKITSRRWSTSTMRHIVHWLQETGNGEYKSYAEVEERYPHIDQSELIRMFKEDAARVDWTYQQQQAFEKLPELRQGLKSGHDDRVRLSPRRPGQEEEEF